MAKRIHFIVTFVCFTSTCTVFLTPYFRRLSKHFHAKMAAKLSTFLIKSAQLLGAFPPNPHQGLWPGAQLGDFRPPDSLVVPQCSLKIAALDL